MSRRHFLKLIGGSALTAACASSLGPLPGERSARAQPGGRALKAVTFDLFTIFDPRGVDRAVVSAMPEVDGLAATWKTRLFEYSWLRAASGRYVDFEQLVRDSLLFAGRVHQVSIPQPVQAELAGAFTALTPWPDSLSALRELKARGLRLAPLANFTPRMIEVLLQQSGLRPLFDDIISTHYAQTYKPSPKAYALAEPRLGLHRDQIAFAAFGGWDAAGARWYGYPTFWVNRLDVTAEQLAAADASGPDLTALVRWACP